MRREDGKIIFSPHDLMNFMASRFVTWMDRRKLDDGSLKPDDAAESAKILQQRGVQHEKRHFSNLQKSDKRIIEIPDNRTTGIADTIKAMQEGYDEIYQAQLQSDDFGGIADFLTKVPGESKLGDWHYEVWDTKLAKKNNPEFIMQLCCYAEMLQAIQGVLPQRVGIILGDGTESAVRTQDYYFFYKHLKASLLDYLAEFDASQPPAEIVIPSICRWKTYGEELLRKRDDLSLIANIHAGQIKKLREAGINTVEQLASFEETAIPNMRSETFDVLKQQARLQVQSRLTKEPCFEVLAEQPGRRGLKLLPPAHALDVFFDMEGYTLSDPPLEYLFGATHIKNGERAFWFRWAHDRDEERAAFEQFVDWALERWERSGCRMHIYHYASYEVTAMRKLMQRYGTREQQIDDLLRNNVFVDLYNVVRQSIRVGEENYSIKSIEKFYRGKRAEAVATAMDSIVAYDKYLNEADQQASSDILNGILKYNQVDCDSTYELAEWLRTLQQQRGIKYQPATEEEANGERKTGPKPGSLRANCGQLAQKLLAETPHIADQNARHRQEILAHLLQFHERESKPVWWEIYEKATYDHDELFDDADCLGWMTFDGEAPKSGREQNTRYRYRFEQQETSIDAKDECRFSHDVSIKCVVQSIDRENGTVVFPFGEVPPKLLGLIPGDKSRTTPLEEAICEIVNSWRDTGTLPDAISHFIDRAEPRIKGRVRGSVLFSDQGDALQQTIELVRNMDRTVLCIQGPPGSGKTYTAAQVIRKLIADGKKVGITSNSHAAVENLMSEISKQASEAEEQIKGFKIDGSEFNRYGVAWVKGNPAYKPILGANDFDLIGGTAWKFCLNDAVGKFDYLFADEAGQVCIANLVAVSRCATNLVLLGDQMQLEQPCQGVHPGDSGKSTLEYYLQAHATIPPELGVFLPKTWRMHPNLCSLVSGAVYEDRLDAVADTAKRILKLPAAGLEIVAAESGVLYVPVEHQGNTQTSEEEVACIRRIIDELLHCSITDEHGKTRPFSIQDVLVVAPYNLQVRALRNGLQAGVKVGTVDKFQGQEAAVSILSMAASDANASPRGLSFLFDKHRLNVALSRAQILSIVVGNPALANAHCSNVGNMALVNFYCRIIEQGSRRPLATSLS